MGSHTHQSSRPFQPLPKTEQKSAFPTRGWGSPTSGIQTKLTIGEANDPYEQEADRVASQVVEQINSPVQREEMPEEEELQMKPEGSIQREEMPEEEELQMKPEGSVQREEMPEEEELQMKPVGSIQRKGQGQLPASAWLENSISQSRGGGSSLPKPLKGSLEKAFSADFGNVRVHTDGQADQMSRSIQAKAFTTGSDIFFRSGAYEPGSRSGQELLAHELTHVVQQNGGSTPL